MKPSIRKAGSPSRTRILVSAPCSPFAASRRRSPAAPRAQAAARSATTIAAPAVLAADPPAPVEVVELAEAACRCPGQLKPVAGQQAAAGADRSDSRGSTRPTPPRASSRSATASSTPCRSIPSREGALYQVYAAPGQITDIALQPGEQLVGSGPVAAGDTVRWIIGDTESGAGATQRVHILVKPTRPDLTTNLVINTDRRTYHLELRSTEKTYMASVSWHYPQDQLIALRRQNAAGRGRAAGRHRRRPRQRCNFRYAIEGDTPPWRPLRAFDDGRQVFIEFPRGIGQGEMPPLFVVGPEGDTSELVNYRVRGNYYDRRSAVRRRRAAARRRRAPEARPHRPHRREAGVVSDRTGTQTDRDR